MSDLGYIEDNINRVKERILNACGRVNRSVEEITLLAVSKTVSEEIVNHSIDLGITQIGENKPQEIKRKFPLINPAVKWHMIGHLQSNKVKMIIDKVSLIQSVDRESVCDEIEKRAAQIDRVVDVLIQVNIGDESQKSGADVDNLIDFIKYVSQNHHIHIKGLMCIAPYLTDPEAVRPYFKEMKVLYECIKAMNLTGVEMEILSMGMTHDFEVAIEEGATMIRVGTGIYGARDY